MQTFLLSEQETRESGFTHKIVITYLDLQAGFTSGSAKAIFPATGTFPAGVAITAAATRLVTSFDGGDTSALTLKVGDGSDDDRVLVSKSTHADSSPVLFWAETAATLPYAYVVADTLDAVFTVTGSSGIAGLTQGEIHILIAAVNLTKISSGVV